MVDSLIRLFPEDAIEFTTMGLGHLGDAISCVVTEERNGAYTLAMEYPCGGAYYEEIKANMIIVCQANVKDGPQAFRISKLTKEITGLITIEAYHISYDLRYILVGFKTLPKISSTYNASPVDIWNYLMKVSDTGSWGSWRYPNNSTGGSILNFTFDSDIGKWKTEHPDESWPGMECDAGVQNARQFLCNDDNSIISVFGGEIHFDNFNIYLHKQRGEDNGAKIIYGRNMKTLEHESDPTNVYDGVLAYYYSDGTSNKLTGLNKDTKGSKYVETEDSVMWRDPTKKGYRVYPLNISDTFTSEEIESLGVSTLLNAAATAWLKNTDYSNIHTNIKIELSESNMYEVQDIEFIGLCDYVTVIHEALDIVTKTIVVKTEYNVLLGRYDSVELGDTAEDLASTLVSMNGSSGGNINYPAKISNALVNSTPILSECTKLSDTQFSAKYVFPSLTSEEGETITKDPITNVFSIVQTSTETKIVNTTTGKTITFKNWG